LVSAFYLVGSIALDNFTLRHSDIDFIAALSRRVSPQDFEKLRTIHKRIERQYPRWKMEGNYFQATDLGRPDEHVEPFPRYHDRKLNWVDKNVLGLVTWWILQNKGIAVWGAEPQTLTYTVDMDKLLQDQRENLNTYWASFTTHPGRILALLSDWGVQWTLLGVLRQFYTLREKSIVSKTAAGEYALEHVPDRWHPIIREAIDLREAPKKSTYHSRFKRASEAFQFIKYIIQLCNADREQPGCDRL